MAVVACLLHLLLFLLPQSLQSLKRFDGSKCAKQPSGTCSTSTHTYSQFSVIVSFSPSSLFLHVWVLCHLLFQLSFLTTDWHKPILIKVMRHPIYLKYDGFHGINGTSPCPSRILHKFQRNHPYQIKCDEQSSSTSRMNDLAGEWVNERVYSLNNGARSSTKTPISNEIISARGKKRRKQCLYNNHNIDLRQVSSIHFGWLFVSKWENLITLRKAKCVRNAGDLSNKAHRPLDQRGESGREWVKITSKRRISDNDISSSDKNEKCHSLKPHNVTMIYSIDWSHSVADDQMVSIMTHNQNQPFWLSHFNKFSSRRDSRLDSRPSSLVTRSMYILAHPKRISNLNIIYE